MAKKNEECNKPESGNLKTIHSSRRLLHCHSGFFEAPAFKISTARVSGICP